jgi:hypothetical protein
MYPLLSKARRGSQRGRTRQRHGNWATAQPALLRDAPLLHAQDGLTTGQTAPGGELDHAEQVRIPWPAAALSRGRVRERVSRGTPGVVPKRGGTVGGCARPTSPTPARRRCSIGTRTVGDVSRPDIPKSKYGPRMPDAEQHVALARLRTRAAWERREEKQASKHFMTRRGADHVYTGAGMASTPSKMPVIQDGSSISWS